MSPAIERETMEVDVLYIGAGPATLASAIHLMNQVEIFNKGAEASKRPPIEPPSVLVLEKSAGVGDHMLSGACMNPKAIAELIPDFREQGFPTEVICDSDWLYLFTAKHYLPVPALFAPPFQKRGYHVISLNAVAKWLGERAEAAGINTIITNNTSPNVTQALQTYLSGTGQLQWFAQVNDRSSSGMSEAVDRVVDVGCRALYFHGARIDSLFAERDEATLRAWFEDARKHDVPLV